MSSSQPTADPRTTLFLLGVATVVAQALLLREAMAAMGGSEMAWGAVMAVWLFGMGFGSRIGASTGSESLARALPIVVLVMAGFGIVLFRAAPVLIGVASGEIITTASAAWLWAVAVVPTAFAGGLAFPILAGSLGEAGGGKGYTIEAVGALVGGALLSAILMGFGTTVSLCLVLALVTAATLWRQNRAISCVIVVAGTLLAPIAADFLARAGWDWSGSPGELRAWCETRLQRLEISDGPPTAIYSDGRLVASYPDPYETLPRAHLTMLLHPDPSRVFAVGCVADGSVEAMALHPVERLVVVEEDPALLRQLPDWYGPGLTNVLNLPHVETSAADPMREISSSGPWDLVILRDGNPTTLRRNRTRTLEFLRLCRNHMSPDGILVMQIAVADTYLGGAAGRLVSTLAATVREVFPRLEVVPGSEILLIAGGSEAQLDLDPEVLAKRLQDLNIETPNLIPEMIPLLVDRERAQSMAGQLSENAVVNTIAQPRAVMLAGVLHEARSNTAMLSRVLELERRGSWPLGVVLAIVVLYLLAKSLSRRAPVSTTAAVVGFSSMGWWLLLIATWQATRGSVYSEIGALTAIFMAGLASGAGFASKWPNASRLLPIILSFGGILSLLIAGGIAIRFPLVGIPLLLGIAGALTGAAFPALTELSGGHVRRSAGIVFAADEVGAAGGALIVGIVSIPWVGLTTTAVGLAVIEIAVIPAVVRCTSRLGAR